jgi:HEAT repeat protein
MQVRRKSIIFILLGSVALLGLIATRIIFFSDNGPSYKGHSLRTWVTLYGDGRRHGKVNQEAGNALRHIGTNALPHLLRWVAYEQDPRQWERAVTIRRLFKLLNVNWRPEDRHQIFAYDAAVTFEALGTQAKPAIPELTRLLNDPSAKALAPGVALACIGGLGAPSLADALASTNEPVRFRAVMPIMLLGTNGGQVVPQLITNVKDPSARVAASAGFALVTLQSESDLALPALTNYLSSTNPAVSQIAAQTLALDVIRLRSRSPSLLINRQTPTNPPVKIPR